MIIYFATQEHAYTVQAFLNEWSPASRERFAIVSYQDAGSMAVLPAGAMIFSDIERLGPSEREAACSLRDAIVAQYPGRAILNDPLHTLRRYDLLTTLADRGLNPFRAYRLTDMIRPDRFPVFVRHENEHWGAISSLLASQDELDRAIVRAIVRGLDLRDLLIVEYTDVSDEHGRFSKYGAMVVGDRIIPRHIMHSEHWVVKGTNELEQTDPQELDYLRANPHGSQLAAICEIAGVEYGRIDYSLIDDRVVTWEINTNPYIVEAKDEIAQSTVPRAELTMPMLEEAFAAIDPGPTDRQIDISDVIWPEPIGLRQSTRQSMVDRLRRHRRVLSPLARLTDASASAFRRPILEMWKRKNDIVD